MNRKLLLESSLRIMSRNKLRTFFMSIGVAVGVATLIAGQSLGTGATKQIGERMDKMFGPGTIYVFSPTLSYGDLESIEDQLEQVVATSPRFGGGEAEISYQGINRQAAVFGHSEKAELVWNRGVIDGRFFTTSDINKTARVALIGPRLAEELFAEADPIDEEILIGSVPFRIIGVLESVGPQSAGSDFQEQGLVAHAQELRGLLAVPARAEEHALDRLALGLPRHPATDLPQRDVSGRLLDLPHEQLEPRAIVLPRLPP